MNDEEEDRRIIEYFVVAGMTPDAEELTAGAQECGCKNLTPQAPVTDICVIFPGLGEQVPDGFACVDATPSGHPADLNHGSLRANSCYLCYRRGYHKPPLVDIGVLYEGKGERVMIDSNILKTTPFGRPANVNNGSQGIYLTYRRAPENAPPSMLAVTDICVILTNKGETPPHTFCKVPKNLNRGMMGSMVFLCYKKSQSNASRLAHKPSVLDRFPREDVHDFPLPPNVPLFCMPMGAVIESWPQKCQLPAKQYVTFVLTDERGRKFYGAAVNFYEQIDESAVTAAQRDKLGLTAGLSPGAGTCSDNSSTNDPAEQMTFHVNRAICVVSRFPFFVAFRRFLYHLHRMTVTGSYPLPIERYISHLMYEIPFPTPRRPRVLVQMGVEYISFDAQDDSQLPLSGAGFVDALKSLGPDNLVYVVLLALLEQKVLVHSLRPWLLTSVAEAVCSLIFPFHWQCPYIPQCPLDLAGVLHAPLPFIAGVDSRYFELYEDPPGDVTCVDLDTQTISQSDVRKTVKPTCLPRKPMKLLKQTLEQLVHRANKEDFSVSTMRKSAEFVPIHIDSEWTRKRRMLDTEIQEAFLRFMAALMKGYQQYLTPYSVKKPPRIGSTDTATLFDLDAFMKSRDRSGLEFYRQFQRTQCFIRFIEERSLLSDKNAYNAMFDDCVSKVDPASEKAEPKLIELDMSANPHTVFIQPPEAPRPLSVPASDVVVVPTPDVSYTYQGFPARLDAERFQMDSLIAPAAKLGASTAVGRKYSLSYGTGIAPAIRRTKPEMRLAARVSERAALQPVRWAKLLLSYAYSLWFVHLPAYHQLADSKQRSLNSALSILDRLGDCRLPTIDEVCYRVVMHLCSQSGKPLTAVRVYMKMKAKGIQPNAVTLGIYHRAVLEGVAWPSMDVVKAESAWARLRNAVRAVTAFKRAADARRERRRVTAWRHNAAHAADNVSINTLQSGGEQEAVLTAASTTDNGYHSQTTMDSVSARGGTGGEPYRARTFTFNSDLELFGQLKNRGGGSSLVKSSADGASSRSGASSYDSPAGLLMMTSQQHQHRPPTSPPHSAGSLLLDDSVFERAEMVECGAGTVARNANSLPRNDKTSDRADDSGRQVSTTDFDTSSQVAQSEANDAVPLKVDAAGLDPLADSLTSDTTATAPPASAKFDLDEIPEEQPSLDTSLLVTKEADTLLDPLGVMSPAKQKGKPDLNGLKETTICDKQPLLMSPARVAFLEKHERTPFEGEDHQGDAELDTTPAGGLGGAWGRSFMKGLTRLQNSTPVAKIIKSQTISEGFSALVGGTETPTSPAGGDPMAASPSLSNIVNQATKWKQQVNDAVQKQQPSMTRLRSGVSSVMNETLRSFKGVNQQMGSPLRYAGVGAPGSFGVASASIGSLDQLVDADDALLRATIYEETGDDECYESGDGQTSAHEDPAFILSSGQTGCISNFDFFVPPPSSTHGESSSAEDAQIADRQLIEAAICSCSRCSACSALNYDEEIMGGWSSDESNLNTTCHFCERPFVPILTVRLKHYAPPPLSAAVCNGPSVAAGLPPPPRPVVDLNAGFAAVQPSFAHSWYNKTPRSSSRVALQERAAMRRDGGKATPVVGSSTDCLVNDRLLLHVATPPHKWVSLEAVGDSSAVGAARRTSDDVCARPPTKGAINRRLFLRTPPTTPAGRTAATSKSYDCLTAASSTESGGGPMFPRDDSRKTSSTTVNMCVAETTLTVPFLSPLVLKREMENLLSADQSVMSSPQLVLTNPILYWNLLYVFQRLSVPTHFFDWVARLQFTDNSAVTLLADGDANAHETTSEPSTADRRVIVRCVYDFPKLHEEECSKPLYLLADEVDEREDGGASSLVAALQLDERRAVTRASMEQMADALLMANVHRPIQMLINEHRKRATPGGSPSRGLPRHCSLYRDLLFFAMRRFGADFQRDQFDREFAAAFLKLPPKVASILPKSDLAPSAKARACRKIFMPLDVY